MSLEQAPCKLKHADTSATGRERCCDMLLNSLLAVIDAWNRYDMGVSEYSSSTTEITYRCLELWGTLCSPYLWVHQHSKISMVRLPSDGLEVGMWTTWSLAIGTMEHHHGSFGLPLCKLRAHTHCRWLFGRPIMEDEVGSVLICGDEKNEIWFQQGFVCCNLKISKVSQSWITVPSLFSTLAPTNLDGWWRQRVW